MTGRRPGGYARAVEEALARARGRPSLLSPRDWARVADWYARGVPLPLVLEALEEAGSRARRRGGEIRGLALVAPAVEESWRAVERGRPAPAGEASPSANVASTWARVQEGRSHDDPLARWLEQARARVVAGTPTDALEDELDLRLPDLAGEERVRQVREEVDRALASFRSRMGAEAFTATHARALRDGLRRALGLPRRSG